MITIPSCSECNHPEDSHDEEIGAFVCAIATVEQNDANSTMYRKRVVRPLGHNRRLYRQVVERADLLELRTESGIVFGEVYATKWSKRAHDGVIKRVVRGLYFHHFEEVLERSVNFSITVFRSWPEKLVEGTNDLRQERIGTNEFVYRFGRTEDDHFTSGWLLQFHEAHMVLVFTEKHNSNTNCK